MHLLYWTVIIHSVTSFPSFRDRIPNGHHVPFPCKPGEIWNGVGHYLPGGSGPRNPFGDDFEAQGKRWTKRLCQKDSDGDGKTNGEELGDPHCEWKEGDEPCFTHDQITLTHPGICDPWNSPKCMSKKVDHPIWTTQEMWLQNVCDLNDFDCPTIKEEGVFQLNVKLERTPVPADPTIYMCQVFDVKDLNLHNLDVHLLAAIPAIDNEMIVHHMVLFGCDDDLEATGSPYVCGMSASPKCLQILAGWAPGSNVFCSGKNAGVSVGLKGVKKLALQVHWNNPDRIRRQFDSSGLTLFFTENKLQFDATVFRVGADYFVLPPGQKEVIVNSRCGGQCTNKKFKGSVYAIFTLNHMHYAGIRMTIKVYRKGKQVAELSNDPQYDFDNPTLFVNDKAIEIRRGDEIRTQCVYDTSNRDKTTYFGLGTLDEMCFGFILVYPAKNLKELTCRDAFEVNPCDSDTFDNCQVLVYSDPQRLRKTSIFKFVMSTCSRSICKESCRNVLDTQLLKNSCLQGNAWAFIRFELLSSGEKDVADFLQRIQICSSD